MDMFLFCWVICVALFALAFAYAVKGMLLCEKKPLSNGTQLGEEKPISRENLKALADRCVMEVDVNNELFQECKRLAQRIGHYSLLPYEEEKYIWQDVQIFLTWLEEHPEWVSNLGCLAEVFPMDLPFDIEYKMKGDIEESAKTSANFELEMILLSVNKEGVPNCAKALEKYLHIRLPDRSLCLMIILDSRFAKVLKIVEDELAYVIERLQRQWLAFKNEV